MSLAPIRDGLFVEDRGTPKLVTGACDGCARMHFPATDTCPYCAASCTATRLVGPNGTVRLCTIVRRPPPGYVGDVPYGFGVVALADAEIEVITRLSASSLEDLAPGRAVRLALVPVRIADDGEEALTWTFEAR